MDMELLRGYIVEGDHKRALKLAASHRGLGIHRDAIQRGWAALSNPEFYREMGYDLDQLVEKAIEAVKVHWSVDG